ncbi:MAG: hypothetical protein AB8H47_14705 [Bacteroidia bacterium]
MLSIFKNLFGLDESAVAQSANASFNIEPEGEFGPLFRQIIEQANTYRKEVNYNVKWSDLEAYQRLKKLPVEKHRECFFLNIDWLGAYWRYLQTKDYRNSAAYDMHSHVGEALLTTLAQKDLAFREADYEQYFRLCRSYGRERIHLFHQWPHNYVINRLERFAEQNPLSLGFQRFLSEMTQWLDWQEDVNYYWGADCKKALQKLKTILYHNEEVHSTSKEN